MVPAWLPVVTAFAYTTLLVALAILALGAIPAFFAIRRQLRRGGEELTKVLGQAAPMIKDATNLVSELRGIATSVKSDAAVVNRLVTDADARLRQLGHGAEARLAELDAAFEVLRGGLEDAVVSVAAVAHGVRAGTAALGIGTEDEEPAPADGAEAEAGDDDDFLEVGARHNGDDRAGSPGRRAGRAQPRIRGQRREE
jgi:hypothetical protein